MSKAAGGKQPGGKSAQPVFSLRLIISGMSYSAGINIAYIDSLIEHMRHIHATVGQHGNVQPASVINLAGQHSPGSARLVSESFCIEHLGYISRISVSVSVHFSLFSRYSKITAPL